VAHLAAELPEVAELDINPLLADAQGVIALDARVLLKPLQLRHPHDRLAIRPYPQELEETVPWMGQPMRLRPIRPEDLVWCVPWPIWIMSMPNLPSSFASISKASVLDRC
jgi:hypothetical protein